jgi:TonB family protein
MGRSPSATPAQPDLDNDLNFLRALREPVSAWRLSRAAAGSIAVHALAVLLFWITPEVTPYRLSPQITPDLKKSIMLVVPKDLLQGPVSSAASTPSRQRQSAAVTPRPEPSRFHPPAPVPGQPGTPAPMIQAPAPAIESPPDNLAAPPSIAGIGAPLTLPPPTPKPKATFEPVGGPPPPNVAKEPSTPAEEALRAALRSASGPVTMHADIPQDLTGIPELRSDPEGVDFTQYFAQAKTKVKQNWLNRIPEAARRGRRGVVRIDFAINHEGLVYGLKIVSSSGIQSFDLAAVGAITASSPFAFLPSAYKKDHIDLTWTFTYSTTQR